VHGWNMAGSDMTLMTVVDWAGEQVSYGRARVRKTKNASYRIANERAADGPPLYVTPVHAQVSGWARGFGGISGRWNGNRWKIVSLPVHRKLSPPVSRIASNTATLPIAVNNRVRRVVRP
jgi:hypothetical protein